MSLLSSCPSSLLLSLSTRWAASTSSVLQNSVATQGPSVLYSQTVRFRSNRSRRGLYDGKDVRTGNNVPFSLKKTKRKFHPNVFIKRVYSEILDTMIPFHLTASALRSMDKAGGLDNYLLTSKHVTEGEGFTVKQKILQKMAHAKKKGTEILGTVVLKSNRLGGDTQLKPND